MVGTFFEAARGASATLDEAIATPQTQPRRAPGRVRTVERPTMLLVGRSWFNNPDWPIGTSAKLLASIGGVAASMREFPNVSMTLNIPRYELDVLHTLAATNKVAQDVLSSLQMPSVSFSLTSYTEDVFVTEDDPLLNQMQLAIASRYNAKVRGATLFMPPRSAGYRYTPAIERMLRPEGVDALLLQRPKRPYTLSPRIPGSHQVVALQGEHATMPALVADRVLGAHLQKYLRGEGHTLDSVWDALSGRIQNIRNATNTPFGVALFSLEHLTAPGGPERLMALLRRASQVYRSNNRLAIRGFDAKSILQTLTLASDYAQNNEPIVLAERDVDAMREKDPVLPELRSLYEDKPLTSMTPYEKRLFAIASDRGYRKAHDFLERPLSNDLAAREASRLLTCEREAIITALRNGTRVRALGREYTSPWLRERLRLIDRVARNGDVE